MTSYTSVEPPFSYNPGYKPTKSILKQRISPSSPSWLTRFSSNDSLPQTQPSSPQQRTFGYFRKLINSSSPTSPGNSQPPASATSLSSSSSSSSTFENEHDELSSAELKRVRFSVNRMTTEYSPYSPKDTDNENNIVTDQNNSINNQHQSTFNDHNTDTTQPHQKTNHTITTTPGKVISYYETACKTKEEPILDVFMASLLVSEMTITTTIALLLTLYMFFLESPTSCYFDTHRLNESSTDTTCDWTISGYDVPWFWIGKAYFEELSAGRRGKINYIYVYIYIHSTWELTIYICIYIWRWMHACHVGSQGDPA